VLFGPTAFCRVILEDDVGQELASFLVQVGCFRHDVGFGGFPGSIKVQKSGQALKVEWIEAPGRWAERRWQPRVKGKALVKVGRAIGWAISGVRGVKSDDSGCRLF
jgi:hypothetical protein